MKTFKIEKKGEGCEYCSNLPVETQIKLHPKETNPTNHMKEINLNEDSLRIVRLYLEKIELLSERERDVLLKTIDILNHPVLVMPL